MRNEIALFRAIENRWTAPSAQKVLLGVIALGILSGVLAFAANGFAFSGSQNREFAVSPGFKIYPAMVAVPLVVFAVPVYRWHTNARTKLWIDRLTALLSPEDSLPALAGRRLILVTSHTHRSCAECTIKMFEDFKSWIGVELNASERCAKDGHVSSVPYKSEAACELGKSISLGMNPSRENGQAGAHRTGIGGGFFRAILCSG